MAESSVEEMRDSECRETAVGAGMAASEGVRDSETAVSPGMVYSEGVRGLLGLDYSSSSSEDDSHTV